MSADEAHPPRLNEEEQLAVSSISVFIATDLDLWAMHPIWSMSLQQKALTMQVRTNSKLMSFVCSGQLV